MKALTKMDIIRQEAEITKERLMDALETDESSKRIEQLKRELVLSEEDHFLMDYYEISKEEMIKYKVETDLQKPSSFAFSDEERATYKQPRLR